MSSGTIFFSCFPGPSQREYRKFPQSLRSTWGVVLAFVSTCMSGGCLLNCGELLTFFFDILNPFFSSSIFVNEVSRSCINAFVFSSLRTYWGFFTRLERLVLAGGSATCVLQHRFLSCWTGAVSMAFCGADVDCTDVGVAWAAGASRGTLVYPAAFCACC